MSIIVYQALAGLALLLLLAGPARAQNGTKKKELSQVQKEIAATRREIEEYKKLQQTLGADLHHLESHSVTARKKIEELKKNIGQAERKKAELRSRLGALKAASGSRRAQLGWDLRQYLMLHMLHDDLYGSLGLWQEAFRRAVVFEESALLSRIQGFSRKTEAAESETLRKARELRGKSQKALEEQQSRQMEYQEKKAVFAQTQEKTEAAMKRAQELEETARALTQLIKQLERQKKSPVYRKSGDSAQLDIARHSLPWPAVGDVVVSFGRERNPRLNTWVIHEGIRLATAAQALVSAVSKGRVIFTGPFRSYGLVMILDHGAGFYSIYGELGEVLRAKGSKVAAGEMIAKAGAGPSKAGGVMYLEIRRGSEALDPLMWLRKK